MSKRRIPRPVQRPGRKPSASLRPPADAVPSRLAAPAGQAGQDLAGLVANAGLELPGDSLPPLERYLFAMLAKNEHVNLTAIRAPDRARILHVLDSVHVWHAHAAPTLALDIGTGNGFPGVAIAALWPSASVLLIDRTQKKIRAISECLVEAGIPNAQARAHDAQQLPSLQPELRGKASLITLRAVGPLALCLRLAEPFLAPDGVIALFKASELGAEEAEDGAKAMRRLRLTQHAEHSYVLPGDEERVRQLLCYRRR